MSQLTFDSTTGTFTGQTASSRDGVITTFPLTGTYTIAFNCTGTDIPAGATPFSLVVTQTGFLAVHPISEGFAVKQPASWLDYMIAEPITAALRTLLWAPARDRDILAAWKRGSTFDQPKISRSAAQ